MKKLNTFLSDFKHLKCIGSVERYVADIQIDSRNVGKHSLFVAIKGFEVDGHKFIPTAIKKGASVIVCQDIPRHIPSDVTILQVENSRKSLADISSLFYEKSDEKLIKIGVTGTNGKTSITYFLKQLADMLGKKCGLIGTIEYHNGAEARPSTHTTPESNELHKLFYEMVQNKCKLCVMEISSHALALNRVEGLVVQHAIFTNLSQDHLDFHADIDDYFNAKKLLFTHHLNGIAHVNADDAYSKKIQTTTCSTFSINAMSDIRILRFKQNAKGSSFTLIYKDVEHAFTTDILGYFNLYNLLACISVCLKLGFTMEEIRVAVTKLKPVKGRMEVVKIENRNVIVDYAHTPDALKNILLTCKPLAKKLTCVFGCGGDRDRTKRAEMARAVEAYADKTIVTSDNPRTENPMEIIQDIKQGFSKDYRYVIEEDRHSAIYFALNHAEEDEIIVIAGKGHETYQEINGVKHHFSDQETVLEWVKNDTRRK